MKKVILLFILLFTLLFSACGRNYDQTVTGEVDKEGLPENELSLTSYVVNTSTYSYHMPTCRFVSEIKEENLERTHDIEFLTKHNYKPCSVCIGNK